MTSEKILKGKLYVCPTPIGNLEDISFRVLKTLQSVDMIAAEDTRYTIRLLNHFEINKKLFSYHEHNKITAGDKLLFHLEEGKDIAIVTDAGMPGISDPGEDLIHLCIVNGIEVIVLPGPSAFVNALVGSGLSASKFAFEGFLDREHKPRKQRLEILKEDERTLLFYESPHRLLKTLRDLLEIMGDRQISVCRELTKIHEEFVRGSISQVLAQFEAKESIKGEFVLVLEGKWNDPNEEKEIDHAAIEKDLDHLLHVEHFKVKDASKVIAEKYKISKNDVYEMALKIK